MPSPSKQTYIRYRDDTQDILGIQGTGRLLAYNDESRELIVYDALGDAKAEVKDGIMGNLEEPNAFMLSGRAVYQFQHLSRNKYDAYYVSAIIDSASHLLTGHVLEDGVMTVEHSRSALPMFVDTHIQMSIQFRWITTFGNTDWTLDVNGYPAVLATKADFMFQIKLYKRHLVKHKSDISGQRNFEGDITNALMVCASRIQSNDLYDTYELNITRFSSRDALTSLMITMGLWDTNIDLTRSGAIGRIYTMGT